MLGASRQGISTAFATRPVWQFNVRNSGSVDLAGPIEIHDPMLPGPLTCLHLAEPATFKPHLNYPALGEAICTAEYRVTQEDLDRGYVLNRAQAFAGEDTISEVYSPWAEARAEAATEASVSLTKTVTPASGAKAGDVLSYRIEVLNTGNVSLSRVSVEDPMLSDLVCTPQAPGQLAPEAAMVCVGTYVATQADIDRGEISNTATAQAVDPAGELVEGTATAIHKTVAPVPGLDLVKTAVRSGNPQLAAPEDQITFTFSLRNSGNTTLENVELRDEKISDTSIATGLTLKPGETRVFTRVIEVTQEMIDTGLPYENEAIAEGNPPGGPEISDPSGPLPGTDRPTVVPLPATGAVTLEKSVIGVVDRNNSRRDDAGDAVEFRIIVRNSGTITLTDVVVTDPLLGGEVARLASLAPGATYTLTPDEQSMMVLALKQDDIDTGRVLNTATVTAKTATGVQVSASDNATATLRRETALSLVKTAALVDSNSNNAADVGETVVYSFLVTNEGNTRVTDIQVTDPMFTPTLVGTVATLAPGESIELDPVSYVMTAADIRKGELRNVAVVTGTGPDESGVQDDSGSGSDDDTPTVTPLNRPPVASPDLSTGNETTKPVTVYVTDNDSDPDGDLDPSSVTFVDEDGKPLLDGNSKPRSELVVPGQGTWSRENNGTITFSPAQGFTRDPDPIRYIVSDLSGTPSEPATVTIEYVARPPVARDDSATEQTRGPVTLDVVHNDKDPDGSIDASTILLEGAGGDGKTLVVEGEGTWRVGPEDGTITFTPLGLVEGEPKFTRSPTPIRYTVKDNDGNLSNPALVTVTYRVVPPVAADDTLTEPRPFGEAVTLDVLLNDEDEDGDLNPATVQIQGAPGNGKTLGVPGEGVWTADPVTGAITFTPEADFYGDPTPIRYRVEDNDGNLSNAARVGLSYVLDPQIELTAEVARVDDTSGDGLEGEGDTVHYRFTVNNPGKIPLENVHINPGDIVIDGQSGRMADLQCRPITLAPGERAVLDCVGASLVLTAEQAEAGQVDLLATARGTDPRGKVVEAEASVRKAVDPGEGIAIEKVAGLGTVRTGQLLPYIITVTNRSSTIDTVVDVRDTLPAGFVYRKGTGRVGTLLQEPEKRGNALVFRDVLLAPGASQTIELQVLVTGSVQPGSHTNRAQSFNPVTGAPNSGVARAAVLVEADPIFDCGTIIGTVFDDRNMDGYQNPGEPGIPGVRLVTVRGTVITTDRHGRYHVPCADLPRAIGTNFVLKLDDRTLPTGFRITTENPGDVRLTAGKMVELNFGASLARLVRLDVDTRAFARVDGEEGLRRELAEGLAQMTAQIRNTPSVLRITCVQSPAEDDRQVRRRLRMIETELRRHWRAGGRYALYLETVIQKKH